MKKLILFLFVVVSMLSCGNKTGKTIDDTDSLTVDSVDDAGLDKHSEAYIHQRIDTIYKTVGKSFNDDFNRDSAYCSQRYYALMQEAVQLTNEMGEILYDFDYWVCGQDVSDDWNYKVAKVYEITDSTALVDLKIHNFSDTETTISLRFEHDDWYIDDFSPSKDGNDDKKYLRETIKRGLKTRKKAKSLVGYWGWVGDDCPELLLRLEMTDEGLKVTECNIYRMYGFDHTTVTFDGTYLCVNELEYDSEAMETKREFFFNAHLDSSGDLTGDCRIKHPIASRNYEGPLTLRKDYFFYRDGAQKKLSDYAE